MIMSKLHSGLKESITCLGRIEVTDTLHPPVNTHQPEMQSMQFLHTRNTQSDHSSVHRLNHDVILPKDLLDGLDGLEKFRRVAYSTLDDGRPSSAAQPPLPSVPLPISNSVDRNADFRREADRLVSLQKWPAKEFMSPEVAAKSGLYYYGDGDRVRCQFCSVELSEWVPGDCAHADHGRWSPSCQFLLKRPVGNVPLVGSDECGIYESKTIKHPNFRTEHSRLESFKDWPARMKQTPQALADAGFYYAGALDQTVCYHCGGGLKDWEDDDDPWEQHALWFTRCPYLVMVKGEDYIEQVLRSKESPEEKPASVAAVVQPAPASAVAKPTSDQLSDEKACKICYGNERNVCFVPCGHVVACPKCALSLQTCPICRKEFTSTIKLFFP